MRDELSLDLMKKGGSEVTTELDKKKLKKSLKSMTAKKNKSKGKDAIMKELEAVKKQRLAQKRFMKTEYVSKELMNLGYNLLEYLEKMRKVSYVSESVREGKFNTWVRVRYMTTRDGKQIHELDEP